MPRPPTGLLGGSFNPPHLAHLMMALLYLEANPGAQVWVVPCLKHPFDKKMPRYEARAALCRAAFAPLGKRLRICDVEARLGGISYTARTLRYLRAHYPRRRFELILGSDILGETGKWKEFDWIAAHFRLFVVPRGRGGKNLFSLPAISSSQIRRRLARGQDVSRLLSSAVLTLIRRHRLYLGRNY